MKKRLEQANGGRLLTLRALASVAAAGVACALWSCGSGEKTPRPIEVAPIVRDVHPMLRGTIGSEVTFNGVQNVLVSGYGLVVGLNGTGGMELPDGIAATMERQMGLKGIGKAGNYEGTAIAGKSPRQLLRDPNVAVVLVQAAIAPGMPEGAPFDVYIRAINATSLEGGTLWSTELRLGEPTTFGQFQTKEMANARGPVFVNPFAEPGQETSGVTRTIGRVLDGGRAVDPLGIELALDNASYARARAMVSAINSRFPPGSGDPDQIARGRNDASIELRIPRRYRDNPGDFIRLVSHLRVDGSFPEETARRYVEAVKAEPQMSDDAAWCLEALGPKALPVIRDLYDTPDLEPRLAGLKAGAGLNDARAAEFLKDLGKNGRGLVRTQAIRLLGKIDAGPTVDVALRDLLQESELTVRVASYEALASRAERAQLLRYRAYLASNPNTEAARYSTSHLEVLARTNLPARSIQGITRQVIDDKFYLDTVPGGEPLMYVTQQGRPRIVLFGDADKFNAPMVVSAWSDRLMLSVDKPGEQLRVYFRADQGDRAVQFSTDPNLGKLIEIMSRKATAGDPRPGLGLTYSEIVGALHAMAMGGGTVAGFATEQDRLRLALLDAASSRELAERPERPGDDPIVIRRAGGIDAPVAPSGENKVELVPIGPPPTKK